MFSCYHHFGRSLPAQSHDMTSTLPPETQMGKKFTERLTSTSVGFKSTSSGKLPSFHDSRISHMTAPVGSRPLSCGPEQCWCWFPRIHRDRFHPPEKKTKKTIPHWDRNITHLFDECDKRQNISPVECTTKKNRWYKRSKRLDQSDVWYKDGWKKNLKWDLTIV